LLDILIQYLETITAYAPTWGFALIFVFMAIESSFIPLPSEAVMIPAGFLAARNGLTFAHPLLDCTIAVVVGAGGSLAGAYFNYFLFGWLGTPFLEKYGKYFFLPLPKLRRAEEIFRQYGPGATFVCRLLPVLRHLISIPAGLARMPHRQFIFWTTLGAAIWCTILTAIGYAIGRSTSDMSYHDLVHKGADMSKHGMIYIAPVLIAGFAAYVWLSNKVMRSNSPAQS
jgi:membrane protein DedA with SNARE-associated domain